MAEFCPPYCAADGGTAAGCGLKPRTKKIMYDLTENDDFDREEIATYEEVPLSLLLQYYGRSKVK